MKEERGDVRWGLTPQVSTWATGPGKFVGLGHQCVVVHTAHGVPSMGLARASWNLPSQGLGIAQRPALPENACMGLGHQLAPTWVEPRGCGWAIGSGNSQRAEHSPEGQGMDFDSWVCVLHCSDVFIASAFPLGFCCWTCVKGSEWEVWQTLAEKNACEEQTAFLGLMWNHVCFYCHLQMYIITQKISTFSDLFWAHRKGSLCCYLAVPWTMNHPSFNRWPLLLSVQIF